MTRHPTTWCGAGLIGLEPLSTSMHLMRLELDAELGFRPGQFCMLNGGPGREMTLGRPFSILAIDGPRLDLLFKVVGEGTRRFAAARPGDRFRVLVPLGTSFAPPADGHHVLLLAGGVGLPPLHAWRAANPDIPCTPCFGARDGGDAPWPLLDGWRVSVDRHVDLPAGREAAPGNVVDLARSLRADGLLGDGPVELLTCGPRPLLAAAVDLARASGWRAQVSTEEHMGCGYGACRGCVVPAAGGGYLTACREGPVFPSDRIDLEAAR